MIPSSPRRTRLFIGVSSLLYFGPDLLLPAACLHDARYPLWSNTYQCILVLVGFAYAPAICRAMVLRELNAGVVGQALDGRPPVVFAQHELPFVLTAGLLPGRCQVFVSSALIARLTPIGLRFLLARAAAHASLKQRMAAVLPVLVFTALPGDFSSWLTWFALVGTLLLWLPLHWYFELDADRQAACRVGEQAGTGLLEILAATASPLDRFGHPPLRWRLRAIAAAVSGLISTSAATDR